MFGPADSQYNAPSCPRTGELATVAWAALHHPDAAELEFSERALLTDAALGRPLSRDASATVVSVAADVLGIYRRAAA